VAYELEYDLLTELEMIEAESAPEYVNVVARHARLEIERLRVENNEQNDDIIRLLSEVVRLRAVRNAEHALADQLARALAAVKADRPSVHTHEVWTAVCDALDDYGKARRER
jgi:hypothetical protein